MLNTKHNFLLYVLLILLFLNGSITNVTATNVAAEAKLPLRHVSAKACKTCHEEIYSQWESSMHANSTALKDPIHGAFYNAVVGNPEQEGIKKMVNTQFVYSAILQPPPKMKKPIWLLCTFITKVSIVLPATPSLVSKAQKKPMVV